MYFKCTWFVLPMACPMQLTVLQLQSLCFTAWAFDTVCTYQKSLHSVWLMLQLLPDMRAARMAGNLASFLPMHQGESVAESGSSFVLTCFGGCT